MMSNTPEYYDNTKGSLYKFAVDHNLNSYELDIIRRIVRCRKKGEWMTDLEKTKDVINLYIEEQGHLYKEEREKLNDRNMEGS